jgi:hypothetical protein
MPEEKSDLEAMTRSVNLAQQERIKRSQEEARITPGERKKRRVIARIIKRGWGKPTTDTEIGKKKKAMKTRTTKENKRKRVTDDQLSLRGAVEGVDR